MGRKRCRRSHGPRVNRGEAYGRVLCFRIQSNRCVVSEILKRWSILQIAITIKTRTHINEGGGAESITVYADHGSANRDIETAKVFAGENKWYLDQFNPVDPHSIAICPEFLSHSIAMCPEFLLNDICPARARHSWPECCQTKLSLFTVLKN